MNAEHDTSTTAPHGAYQPVTGGHVIISFAREWHADEALRALVELGFAREIVHQGSDPALIASIAQDLTTHSLRNESWLAHAQLDFAGRGRHWLVLRTGSDGRAFQIADCVTSCGATSVQYYGNLVVDELLNRPAWPPTADSLRAQRRMAERVGLGGDPQAAEF